MTLGELIDRASHEPVEVRASRAMTIVRRMWRVARQQRRRDEAEFGWRDLGGEGG